MPHEHTGDAVVLCLKDFQSIRPDLQAYRTLRDSLQRFGNQAVDGLGTIRWQVPAENLVQFADRRGALYHQSAIGLRMNVGVVQVLLAFELTDNFFENIFKADDAQHL